jgi:hypothetical protein
MEDSEDSGEIDGHSRRAEADSSLGKGSEEKGKGSTATASPKWQL